MEATKLEDETASSPGDGTWVDYSSRRLKTEDNSTTPTRSTAPHSTSHLCWVQKSLILQTVATERHPGLKWICFQKFSSEFSLANSAATYFPAILLMATLSWTRCSSDIWFCCLESNNWSQTACDGGHTMQSCIWLFDTMVASIC